MTRKNMIQVVIITIVLGLMMGCSAFPGFWRFACGIWFVIFLVENFRFIFIEKGGRYGKK